MNASRTRQVSIYHNILWPKYKGAVLSAVFAQRGEYQLQTRFVHIAETEKQRALLGAVDLSYHTYPYRLLFRGPFGAVPAYRRFMALLTDLLRNSSELVILPGYHRFEYWAMLSACMLLGRKRAVFCDSTVNDQPKNRLKDAAKSWFFGRCHRIFCYGTRSMEYVASYGVKASKITIHVQAAALPHEYDASEVVRFYENNLLIQNPRFLYVGRLSQEKGLIDLLEAFRNARQQMSDATLDLVGAGVLAADLQARANELGLASALTIHGTKTIAEIAAMLMTSTALVLPSHSEPWGLVVNEALSYGCPVVVSDICGCVPELVLDGNTGVAFPVGNIDRLCDALLSITRLPGSRLDIAKRCLNVMTRFTPERAAAEILKGCVQILAQS